MQRSQPTTKVLGLDVTPPGVDGLLRMLGFLLFLVATVEIVDSLSAAVWTSEGSVALIIGAFCGFLLNECGVSLSKHGWRAFALLMMCSSFVFAAASLVV